jgi:hypothetical protein
MGSSIANVGAGSESWNEYKSTVDNSQSSLLIERVLLCWWVAVAQRFLQWLCIVR